MFGSTRWYRSFSRTAQGAWDSSNSAPMAVLTTITKATASNHPMIAIVMPNRPNSSVYRSTSGGM